MSSNSFSFNNTNNNLLILKENFLNYKEEESSPINPSEYIISIDVWRANMVNWLSFLCNKLNFTEQTLFRSVSLFDQYISQISNEQALNLTQEKLSLITIACLSLSTKLEEINCNYISFLNEKVLNSQNSKQFSNNDLTKMEFTILKALKYKIIYSTPLDFIEIYLKIFSNFLKNNNSFINPEILSNIRGLSINIMKNNINNENYLINTASHFSYLCFIQALNQLSIMNYFSFKQLEKTIFIFNYQLGNIF
jgi:hypothetical protein